MENKPIIIKTNELEAVAICASKKDASIHYLKGVYVELYKDGGHALIAADGHRMSVIGLRKEGDVEESFIISTSDIKKIITYSKAAGKALSYNFEGCIALKIMRGEKLSVNLTVVSVNKKGKIIKHFNSFESSCVDGVYPDFRSKIPEQENIISNAICINSDYIADFGKIYKILTGEKKSCVIIKLCGDKYSPILIELPECDFIGVLMPISVAFDYSEFNKIKG